MSQNGDINIDSDPNFVSNIVEGSSTIFPLYSVIGVDIVTVILAGVIFFVVSSWYTALYEVYRHWRGKESDYQTAVYFAVIWTVVASFSVIFVYGMLKKHI